MSVMPKLAITKTSQLPKVIERLAALEKMDVLVGIPAKRAQRKEGKVNNAQLLYIHTNGSALRHIPARPVIEPAIKYEPNRKLITLQLANASAAYMDGDPGAALADLRKAGQVASNACHEWFFNPANHWRPSKKVLAFLRTHPRAQVGNKGVPQTLIDTHQMIRAITWVIRQEGRDVA